MVEVVSLEMFLAPSGCRTANCTGPLYPLLHPIKLEVFLAWVITMHEFIHSIRDSNCFN